MSVIVCLFFFVFLLFIRFRFPSSALLHCRVVGGWVEHFLCFAVVKWSAGKILITICFRFITYYLFPPVLAGHGKYNESAHLTATPLHGECQTEWGVVWWRKQSTKKHKNTGSPKRQRSSLTTCTAPRSRIGTRFHFIRSSSPPDFDSLHVLCSNSKRYNRYSTRGCITVPPAWSVTFTGTISRKLSKWSWCDLSSRLLLRLLLTALSSSSLGISLGWRMCSCHIWEISDCVGLLREEKGQKNEIRRPTEEEGAPLCNTSHCVFSCFFSSIFGLVLSSKHEP